MKPIYIASILTTCTLTHALPPALLPRDFQPLPDDPSNGPTSVVDLPHDISKKCGTTTYTYNDIYDAASWGMKLQEKGIARGKKSKEYPNGRFPHSYTDTKFDFGKNCPADDNRHEYPLVTKGPYNGGLNNNKWGNDRVVYYHEPGEIGNDGHPLGYYCGTITHSGAPTGQFVECK
ncbi:ribonuclease domain-containing protein [Pochonia chlamydosporia 170]|uniref:ribonuclease T1 n=1 Tax=Pochonia chlamydosporia 170 TaxID=1380566 RepID=A0A179FGU9_METCM|nr:ribonuclease domain-containing protein [Pochonia chlamydosporia 170]OAQ64637.2 ribonuclease domain-containing protein [Pochonia chlamydosporia 170]